MQLRLPPSDTRAPTTEVEQATRLMKFAKRGVRAFHALNSPSITPCTPQTGRIPFIACHVHSQKSSFRAGSLPCSNTACNGHFNDLERIAVQCDLWSAVLMAILSRFEQSLSAAGLEHPLSTW
eukprot:5522268-Amphidinium_carterae.2